MTAFWKILNTQKSLATAALLFASALSGCAPVVDSGGGAGDAPELDASDFGMSWKDDLDLGDNAPRFYMTRSELGRDGGNANGTTVLDDECVADPDSAADRDIFCVLHTDELDLQFHQVTLETNAPASKCEFTRFTAPWYWDAPAGTPTASRIELLQYANGTVLDGYGTTKINNVSIGTFGAAAAIANPAFTIDVLATTGERPVLADGAQVMITNLDGAVGASGALTLKTGRYYTVRDYVSATGRFNLAETETGLRYTISTADSGNFTMEVKGLSSGYQNGARVDASSGEIECAFDYSATDGPNCCGTTNSTYTVVTQTLGDDVITASFDGTAFFSAEAQGGTNYFVIATGGGLTGVDVGATYSVAVTVADDGHFDLVGATPVGVGGTVTMRSISDADEAEAAWGGDISACAAGPGIQAGPKFGGFPGSLYNHIPSGNVTTTYGVQKGYSLILPYNFRLANFYPDLDPDDTTTWPKMFRAPADLETLDGIDLSDWGATSIDANPLYWFECLNRDEEVQARVLFAIQDWNDSDEFEEFVETGSGDPDTGQDYTDEDNYEGNFPYSPINDFADVEDVEDYYGNPFVLDPGFNVFSPGYGSFDQWPANFSIDESSGTSLSLASVTDLMLSSEDSNQSLLLQNPVDLLSSKRRSRVRHRPRPTAFRNYSDLKNLMGR
jgi:hypothetical protein